MSNAATWGSSSPQYYTDTQDNNHNNGKQYSPLDTYIQHPETHEQTALGYGTMKEKNAIEKREKKMKKKIEETGKRLPK
ncbi:hypothetical protein EG329_010682 [Mollisiaceae sp. DMI_Dod_QoI]|nr:hypothetical protein EG329_010682 [Helotiales sp. DMI_Dod_QoI]